MKILITGASGFVGRPLCDAIAHAGHAEYSIVPVVRTPHGLPGEYVIKNIDAETDWREALRGIHAVIHLAARVHVMHDSAVDPLAVFRSINTAGTLNLARQVAAAGVRRFVFVRDRKSVV